ncbi:hypothetical protein XBKB1_4230030 [Xenorhabdus bovienii str. kraussei Becker Underwood]|uniref:Uncharacterized protein n=1 Tax=Xenorhabdus bovienii str. kraussei Becker Underwood TaxID=1398204 RepID=A0A077PNA7_XENBV|nr:hypothetical protein XBKB1_4230030 [Xenorhabdus bovienii str. kraussei Becker Underwood]
MELAIDKSTIARLSKLDCITASFVINNATIISLCLKTNEHLMRTIN